MKLQVIKFSEFPKPWWKLIRDVRNLEFFEFSILIGMFKQKFHKKKKEENNQIKLEGTVGQL